MKIIIGTVKIAHHIATDTNDILIAVDESEFQTNQDEDTSIHL